MSKINIISIEMEELRERVKISMMSRSSEFDVMIKHSVDKLLTVENLQARVDEQVAKVIDSTICSVSSSHVIKNLLVDMIEVKLSELVKSTKINN